jgi:hypothetical protein
VVEIELGLNLRRRDSALVLVLAAAILVRGLANLVRFEEHNLGDAAGRGIAFSVERVGTLN